MLSALRLFKALPVETKAFAHFDGALASVTIPDGYIFAPEVTRQYDVHALLRDVNALYGKNGSQLNAGFHKSFAKVRDASSVQLYVEQVLHYLSAYLNRAAGLPGSVFIPAEDLTIPDLDDSRLVVIRGLTMTELRGELLTLLRAGVALSEQSVADALDIAKAVGLGAAEVDSIKNLEVQVALYDHLGIVPVKPEAFVRFLVFKATGRTQVVKNAALVAAIKATDDPAALARYFHLYDTFVGIEKLATVFNRFKPVFLALRLNVPLKKYVNRIRRLSVAHHVPMRQDYLNGVTASIKDGSIDADEFRTALNGASFFRKARLAYALQFRANPADSVVYRVRNGKSWATSFGATHRDQLISKAALAVVLDSIVEDVSPKVEGKKIFLPSGVTYGLPSSEKQFTGNIPAGTAVEVTDNMVIGVHWENVSGYHTDLDLSMTSVDGKIGWDGSYRDHGNAIYFSGDLITAPAPNGAAEVFHVGAKARGSWLLNLNYFSYQDDVPVPFKIVVARDEQRNIGHNYLIDPNKVIALSPSVISDQHKMLGLVVADDKSTRFVFSESSISSGISAGTAGPAEQARKYLLSAATNALSLNDVLSHAGAVFVDSPAEADIDLSLEAADKSTILSLLS